MNINETISLQYHDQLNPALWSDDQLVPSVRRKLMLVATAWRVFAKIPRDIVVDTILTGGNANYNYTSQSDLDVHIVIEANKFTCDKEVQREYFMAKKALWADNHNIMIKGYPVELFAQPIDEKPHKGQGVYSLQDDKWIQKPRHEDYNFKNDTHLQNKVDYYTQRIDDLVNSGSHDEASLRSLSDKLKQMRGAALSQGGEFSFENLVFKELRNQGALDKLSKYIRKISDRKLSLR